MILWSALFAVSVLQTTAVFHERHPPIVSASVPPAPTVPPAPPAPATNQSLLAWLPGEARCGGEIVAAVTMRRPWTNLSWSTTAPSAPIRYSFSIDATGRTLNIRRQDPQAQTWSVDDIAPSLAATRFAPGAPRSSCTIAYVARQTALADSPTADLISYTIFARDGALPAEGWARITQGSTCADAPRPQPLVQVSPDFRSLPATPGVRDWTMVAYDLDARGRPVAVHRVEGTGNAALDAAAVKALTAWRFTDGTPRHGCLYPYWRAPATLAAPPVPEEESVRPAGATCPSKHDWSVMPTLTFPPNYARRAIEGWALVTYDVAPWGEIGNLRVVKAQPTEDFGNQALYVIRNARLPTTQGYIGCVDRVRFEMPKAAGSGAAGVATIVP